MTPLRDAIRSLAGVDDGAVTRDGVGFSQSDTAFGRAIAQAPVEAWTPEIQRAGWLLARKYRVQLGRDHGIDFDAIPEPPAASAPTGRPRWVEVQGTRLAIKFGYEPDLLGDVRATGARWNGGVKQWEAPLAAKDRVLAFADQHGFTVAPEVYALDVASAPVTHDRRVSLRGALLVLTFPYDIGVVNAVRALPGRTWDDAHKEWTVPVSLVRPVRAFAAEHHFHVEPEVAALEDTEPVVPVSVRSRHNGFEIDFPYDRTMIEQVQEIPGAHRTGAHTWAVPRNASVEVLSFVKHNGAVIERSAEMALHEAQQALANMEASAARSATYDVPGLGRDLYSFQRAGVQYMVEVADGRGIIGDEPGLGKTAQALAVLQARGTFPAVIVAPAVAKINWEREARGWLPDVRLQRLTGTTPYLIGDADLVILNYDILHHWLDAIRADRTWAGVVFDESHRMMNPRAQRTIAGLHLADTIPAGGTRLALTGTPILQHVAEVAPQLEAVGRMADFGGRIGFRRDYRRAPIALNRQMRTVCYVRRRKVDVLEDLPPKTWANVFVDGDPRVMVEYRRAERDIVEYLRQRAATLALESGATTDEAREAAVRAGLRAESARHLVAITHLKQLAAKAKMPAARRWVADFLASDRKLVAFAWHTEIVNELATLHPKAVKVQGGQSEARRQAAMDAFQTDDGCVLVAAQIKAAGEAITLHASSDCLFLEQGWNPGTMDQAVDRTHRIGQVNPVTGWLMQILGTIDVPLAGLIAAKRVLVDAATDGIVTEMPDDSLLGDLLYGLATQPLDSAA